MNTKKISLKKYILTIILLVCSTGLGLYLINLYNNNQNYKNSENKVMSFLSEVEGDSLNSYLADNHEAIIYISSSNDTKIRNYETKLKRFIIKENLEKEILYLDSSNLNDEFYETFKNTYGSSNYDIAFEKTNPNFIIIVDGKITGVLYKDAHTLDIDTTKEFIKENIGD